MPSEGRIDRRIFIVGFPRSGTTLVQSLLAAHSALTSFTESHFFWKHFTVVPILPEPVLTKDPTRRLREFLAENGEARPEAAEWFEAGGRGVLRLRPLLPFQTSRVARRLLRVLDELTLRRGRSGWVEKTPKHLRYVPFLERVSSDVCPTHFVHVIRNGLDAVSSLYEVSKLWERPYGLDVCVRRWNADVGFSLSRVAAPRDHFVFYEELVANPETIVRRLVVALGLDWEPAILERQGRSLDSLVTDQEPWKAGVGDAIRRSEDRRGALTAAQRDRAARVLRLSSYHQLLELANRSGEKGAAPSSRE